MAGRIISINRAPVLILWAATVLQRLGFDKEEALTLAQAVARLNAKSKGEKLGIFKPHEEKPNKARAKEPGEQMMIEVCGRPVPAINTKEGIRAIQRGKVVAPDRVERYLEDKFADELPAAATAMKKLAHAYKPRELAAKAYSLYEQFRPAIPEGIKGWGAQGALDLGLIERMAKKDV